MTATQAPTLSERRIRYIIKTYNKIASRRAEHLHEVPDFALKHLVVIPYSALIVPFVIEDMDKGYGRPSLRQKYNVSDKTIRNIGINYRGKK